jgi:putative mycofactocin binding protein MftB
MQLEAVYRLWDGVQVREEKFGLLFYDYRGPRLYFLPSKDLFAASFFSGERTARDLVDSIHSRYGWSHEMIGKRVTEILGLLRSKELIYEQSIC